MLYGEESKRQLDKYLEKFIANSEDVQNRKSRRRLYDELLEKFGMTVNVADEILTFKKDLAYFTPFELFAVMWFLDRNHLGKFFTDNEITTLSNERFEDNVAKFPVVFADMVQVADDQWIGRTTVKELMALRSAQLFNYDENEQRALMRVKSGKSEYFKPFVNKRSVAEIKSAMEDGRYIPDPITLNMGEGAEFDFSNNTLTVYSLPNSMFNLDDGFHRTLAMSQIYDFDHNFDYPMELRIVSFSPTKANLFIFQQDQKNQMKKIVSATYDPSAIANKIISRLNSDPASNVCGMIGRNNSQIDSAVLAKLINYYFVPKKIKKDSEMAEVLRIKTELLRKFNALTEQDQEFLSHYSDERLFITIAVFASSIAQADYAETIKRIEANISEEDRKLFNVSNTGSLRKKAINIINDIIEKEIG